MTFIGSQDFVSKIKHIFGYLIAIIMVFSTFPGITLKTDKVDFKFEQNLTTESKSMTVEMKNKSLLSIENDVTVKKFEKRVGDEWVDIEINQFINDFPAVYLVYPSGCILPFETYKCTISFSSLCNQETLSAGDYRIVLEYYPWNDYTHFTDCTCEFTVNPA